MSRRQKLATKLQTRPKDFTWNELTTLLRSLGYRELRRGKSSGSRSRFIHETAPMVSLHEPHPGNELKAYQDALVVETLRQEGLL